MSRRGENPETDITKQIRWILDLLKIRHFKHFAGPLGERGIPDLICVIPPDGKSLYIEVKTPTGQVSDEQQAFLDKVRAAGAVAFVARSPHDVINALTAAGFKPAERIKMQFPGRPGA